jgi:hypothetical protein
LGVAIWAISSFFFALFGLWLDTAQISILEIDMDGLKCFILLLSVWWNSEGAWFGSGCGSGVVEEG